MNPLQRKANTVEMTKSTDHRDVSGGLGRRLRRPRFLPYVALVAVVAAIPVAAGSAAGPALPKPRRPEDLQAARWGHPGSSEQRQHSNVHADAIVCVGTGSGCEALRVRALDEQVLPRRERRGLVEQDADDPGDSCSDLSAVDHRPFAVLARPRACRRPRLQVERHGSLQHALDVRCPAAASQRAGLRQLDADRGRYGL